MPETRPYGSWPSPVTPEMIASSSLRLGEVRLSGSDTYWLEGRPANRGRMTLVCRNAAGETKDLTPPDFNIRTRVHEYGGGAWTVHEDEVYACNLDDGNIYRLHNGKAERITDSRQKNYADLEANDTHLVCVQEDLSTAAKEPVNSLVLIELKSGKLCTPVSDNDFYYGPRLSPDGSRLLYITWNHPNMPWDGSELHCCNIDGSEDRLLAGSESESIFQAEWLPDGGVVYISDLKGWWNPWLWHKGQTEILYQGDREFGWPAWVFRMSSFKVLDDNCIAGAFQQNGTWSLYRLDLGSKELQVLPAEFTEIEYLDAASNRLVFKGGSSSLGPAVAEYDLAAGKSSIFKKSSTINLEDDRLSRAHTLRCTRNDDDFTMVNYYPPCNPDCRSPEGELPPLIIKSHGGPTASASTTLSMKTQFWCTRGFAVADVNYGGSTGYGREYRTRLDGAWGIRDAEDCIRAAEYLVAEGLADPERLIISGSSAGGYTTLAALTFYDTFSAGSSYYGISDLEALVRDTHKFEARYLDRLVGPYPEAKSIYQKRSPIHFPEKLSCPVIFFQGLDDRVVPPDQSARMAEALEKQEIPVAYLTFAGESHGFRQADTIKTCLEAEYYFFCRIFGIPLTDNYPEYPIKNL